MEKDKSKIGDKFEYQGQWYEVMEEKSPCKDCDLSGRDCTEIRIQGERPQCVSHARLDGKNVIFKECEPPTDTEESNEYAIGEVFGCNGKSYKVAEGGCKDCVAKTGSLQCIVLRVNSPCLGDNRKDRTDVMYVEFEPLTESEKESPRKPKKAPFLKKQIKERLAEAKAKHPTFPTTTTEALPILIEEVGELAKAINDSEGKEREKSELLDIVAVCVRMLENYKESEK